MIQRTLLIGFLALLSFQTLASQYTPFTEKAFNDYQKQGIPVLIDIYATWCPTCERQQLILKRYFKENPDSRIKVLVVDYDKDKQWVKHFKAPRQSTFYLYHNNEQRWFSVAETRTHIIEKELNKYSDLPSSMTKL